MFDPSRAASSSENDRDVQRPDVQRRGLRELRKLPGSGAAAIGVAASTKRALHDPLQKRAMQDGCEESGDALPRQFRPSEPVIGSSVATEQAKLFHAMGMDLLHSLPEAAHGYVQRALRTAPKESWLLSEIMGSACVALNRLKRHSEALRMAEQACELLKRGQQPSVQLAAMLHNKSACHEYLGDNASALQATEKGLQLAERMRLPEGDELVARLEQSKTKLVAKLTDPKAKASTRPREEGLCKACGERRPAAAEMRATTDVVEALLRRHADAEAALAALRADAEGAAGLRATAAALQGRLLLLEEEARAAEEAREAVRCEAEDAAKKAAKAHELVVARLRAEVGLRAEAEEAAARFRAEAEAAVATLEEEKRSATERVAALEAEAARREQETAAAAREAEVRGMYSSR